GRGILRKDTLEQMWKPQFNGDFGLGFALSRFEGHRRIGHGGAVYGFATDLSALPDERLGAVVVTTMDSANPVVAHIGREALRLMLAMREGKPAPAIARTEAVPETQARKIDGRYAKFDLESRNGKLYMTPRSGGHRVALRLLDGKLITDDLLGYGEKVEIPESPPTHDKPAPAPSAFRNLIGEYGWDYDTLYILEKDGQLTALIEWY